MGAGNGFDWGDLRKLAGPVLQAVLTAVLVALLVLLGYPISPIYDVGVQDEEPGIGIMGISHFSSVYSNDDLQAVDDVIAGDDCTVAGLVTIGETLAVTGASTFTGDLGAAILTASGTLDVTGEATFVNLTTSGTLDVAGVSTIAGPIDATGALTVTGTLDALGTLDVVGVTTLAASARVGLYLGLTEQTFISLTAGDSITPTGSYLGLQSAAAVTTSTSIAITDGAYVGQILILVNENASDAITIDDGGNTQLSGDAVLGEGDTLMVIWDGADWLEVAQANNT